MSILTAKLYIPRLPPQSVPRPRLIALLEQGRAAGRKLSLVSAGPGFGKTTLVAATGA
jgi:LuxR family maltose regulon positive regulatory protein